MYFRNSLSPPVFPADWASDWGEDRYGLWMALTYQKVRLVFRWMIPGTFWMGSKTDEKGRYDQNEDYHQVTLSQGFWIADTTVTQDLWRAVTSRDSPVTENMPITEVSWDDAQAFIKQLNSLHPQLSVRLPWEAEWEYACRAGTVSAFNFEGELSLDKVNYRGTWEYDPDKWGEGAVKATVRVKHYPCNGWGLYEMHGNVWEWCQDFYQAQLGQKRVINPWNTPEADSRVLRGGSWANYGRDCRSALRLRFEPAKRFSYVGFRLALGHLSSS